MLRTWPWFLPLELLEAEHLVPVQRLGDVGGLYADFEESSQPAHRSAPAAIARSRERSRSRATSLSLQSGDDSGQPAAFFSMSRARNAM